MAYSNTKIDYEYIIHLIQNIVTPDDEAEDITPEERQKKIDEVKQFEQRTHKRLIDITSATAKTTDALTKLDLPSGVDIEIKL